MQALSITYYICTCSWTENVHVSYWQNIKVGRELCITSIFQSYFFVNNILQALNTRANKRLSLLLADWLCTSIRRRLMKYERENWLRLLKVSVFVEADGTSQRSILPLKPNWDNISARFYAFCRVERICVVVSIVQRGLDRIIGNVANPNPNKLNKAW